MLPLTITDVKKVLVKSFEEIGDQSGEDTDLDQAADKMIRARDLDEVIEACLVLPGNSREIVCYEILRLLLNPENEDIQKCPGCGCMPGDGYTPSCNHPDGCGFYKSPAEYMESLNRQSDYSQARGILPMKEGDKLPEEQIRETRDEEEDQGECLGCGEEWKQTDAIVNLHGCVNEDEGGRKTRCPDCGWCAVCDEKKD
jgi:hypothetical protein